ncbi:hypothetical protein CLOBAR_00403 [Intestinibacter bartlettii DSM 16795]|nr:hypothetical protein CLOBAR_00403 [Intestinibacter bartlettii DSM 16795]
MEIVKLNDKENLFTGLEVCLKNYRKLLFRFPSSSPVDNDENALILIINAFFYIIYF